MEQLFSIFEAPIEAARNQAPAQNVDLEWAYQKITTDPTLKSLTDQLRSTTDSSQKKIFKVKKLPAAEFGALATGRGQAKVKEESGLICIDADHLSDQGWAPEDLKHAIFEDPLLSTRLAFISPSGDGLKAVLDRPCEIPHEDYFKALCNYMPEAYNFHLDSATKNISWLCFLCHDSEALFSPQAHTIDNDTLQSFMSAYGSEKAQKPTKVNAVPGIDKGGVIGAFCHCYTISEAIETFLADIYSER